MLFANYCQIGTQDQMAGLLKYEFEIMNKTKNRIK